MGQCLLWALLLDQSTYIIDGALRNRVLKVQEGSTVKYALKRTSVPIFLLCHHQVQVQTDVQS